MEHMHAAELIRDPQWVNHCVEKGCLFEDCYVRGDYWNASPVRAKAVVVACLSKRSSTQSVSC